MVASVVGARLACFEQRLQPEAACSTQCSDVPPLLPQLLLAPLRELEGWLFSEMLKHLWWRVLLQEIAALQPNSSSSLAGTSPLASSTAGLRGSASNSAIARSAQSAPHLAAGVARGSSEGQGAASMQGTPRSFETPEVRGEGVRLQGPQVHAVKRRPSGSPLNMGRLA